MAMNLISQNCLTGDLNRYYFHNEYQNPFVWTVISFNDMYKLINEWDNINFLNYTLVKDKNWNFSIVIDNKIKIQYVHYKFSPQDNKPRKVGVDIYYNKIWEYIVEKYEKRIKRMLEKNQKPIFCICNFKTIYKDAIYTKEELSILEKYNNVKILKNCENLEPGQAASIFYKTYFI